VATTVSRPVVRLRGHTDDYFFGGISLLILGAVFLGFAHSYYLAGTIHAHLPSAIIHVHAVIFSSWILLSITQIALVSIGKVGWHKKLGIAGAVLACLMLIFGILASVDEARRYFVPPGGVDSSTMLAIQATELSLFTFLVAWGIRARRDGAAHKRLITIATFVFLGPAVSRWPFAFIVQFPPSIGFIIDAFLLSVIVFDLVTLRRVHRATIWGALSVFLMVPAMFALGHAGFWRHFTEWVQR
jgi:hypothetical protein